MSSINLSCPPLIQEPDTAAEKLMQMLIAADAANLTDAADYTADTVL